MFLPSLESVILHTGFILSLVAVLDVIIKHRNIWREKTAGLFLRLCLVCVCLCVLSCLQLFVTPWTVAYQAPLSMEFSRQEY